MSVNVNTLRLLLVALLDPPPLAPSTVAAARQEACRCRLSATVTQLCVRLTRLRVTTNVRTKIQIIQLSHIMNAQ